MKELIYKRYSLKVKAVEDDGTFSGYASVFGNIDSDGEIVDKGAFKRTLDHSKGVIPIYWQHDSKTPVGWNVTAEEDDYGLAVKGKLLMKSESGRYAHDFITTGLEVGGKPGLSIGFQVPRDGDYVKEGVRHFKEVALREYSIVSHASNVLSAVTEAKSAFQVHLEKSRKGSKPMAGKAEDFNSSLAEAQVMSALYEEKYQFQSALSDAIDDICEDATLGLDDKKAAVATSLTQYTAAMADWWGRYLEATADEPEPDEAADGKAEKAGKTISAHTAATLSKANANLMEAEGHAKAAAKSRKRAMGYISALQGGYVANDINKPNPMGKKGSDPDELHSLLAATRRAAQK